jgi:hypothetical protein
LHDGVQTPETQAFVPFWAWQVMPQPPQFDTLFDVGVSQPLFGLPSQFAQPAEQLGTHTPALQAVVPWSFEQPWPQAPQWVVDVCVFASQPFETLPSQLWKPGLHTGVHTPDTHEFVPFCAWQALLQAPQWDGLLEVFVSQPSATPPVQSARFALQTIEHAPSAQDGVPPLFEQAFPHDPQWATVESVDVSQPVFCRVSQLP